MSKLIKFLLWMQATPRSFIFERITRNARKHQTALLAKILRENTNTAFGRNHKFENLKTIEEFRSAVPIRCFEGHRPYMQRAQKGEKSVLTHEDPVFFLATSGTTSEPKLIPLTKSGESAMSIAWKHLVHNLLATHPDLVRRKCLILSSPEVEGVTEGGIPFGSASGRSHGKSIPWYAKQKFPVPRSVANIEDYDTRYFMTIRMAIEHDIGSLITPNPSTLVRLAEVSRKRAEELVRAVHDGTLGIDAKAVVAADSLKAMLAANPQRAKFLESLLQENIPFLPQAYWPNLQAALCWTGGSVGTQLRMLPALYGSKLAIRDIGYIASEGRFTIPLEDYDESQKQGGGVLALGGNFFEFIPEEEIEAKNPHCLLADELEVGKRYYIIITSTTGLYRYDINDVVEVVGFYNQSPKLVFVRKGRDMASITGEKLHVNHCQAAFAQAAPKYSLEPIQFRFAANAQLSRYEVFLELENNLRQEQLSLFANALDESLCQQNMEYKSKRNSGRIGTLIVHLMNKGWHEEMRQRWVRAGKRDIQFKWKQLVPEIQNDDLAFVAESSETRRAA